VRSHGNQLFVDGTMREVVLNKSGVRRACHSLTLSEPQRANAKAKLRTRDIAKARIDCALSSTSRLHLHLHCSAICNRSVKHFQTNSEFNEMETCAEKKKKIARNYDPAMTSNESLDHLLRETLRSASQDTLVHTVVDAHDASGDGGDVDASLSVFRAKNVLHNPPSALLIEEALRNEPGSFLSASGALCVLSGSKTGRSPADKRIVRESATEGDVWWTTKDVPSPCIPLSERSFLINRERAIDYLNTRDTLYVIDAFAGHQAGSRVKVRLVCSRAYHALFLQHMLIKPTADELAQFGRPDFIIYNAGCFPANRFSEGLSSSTVVALHLARHEMVILGTEYAGEMKKGVLTLFFYLIPKLGHLTLHSSANEAMYDGTTTLFFGLSGTGKTTLSADPKRRLIGDDETLWTAQGISNVEGGCYAKLTNLTRAQEPEIYDALRFPALLENVVVDPSTRVPDYTDLSLTENTRGAYPLEHIPNAKLPALGSHPTNIIMLTCDAFGILPPVSKLSHSQLMYHYISGFTSKTPGTEVGIKTPSPTFSACFGEPFLVMHPTRYAELLRDKVDQHKADVWLINTGWVGGAFGVGKRCPLKYTRAIINAIHDGSLARATFDTLEVFRLQFPLSCNDVPPELLNPKLAWADPAAYTAAASSLAKLFIANFDKKYAALAAADIIAGGPQLS
jgi:phosphoenolpyruvate carboxykinase (ATP)